MSTASRYVYTGARTHQISFPLGGLGAGCIGLAGNGRLVDWEIFNRPNKNSVNGYSHFAIRAEADGEVVDARVLHGDIPPHAGEVGTPGCIGFGFGPRPEALAGLPHFQHTQFTGTFPIASLQMSDPKFPGAVTLEAFNPFIPHEDKDSSLPCAFFEFEIRNTTKRTLDYTLAGSLANPLPVTQVHTFRRRRGCSLIHLASDSVPVDDPRYGTLTLGTDADEVSHQLFWSQTVSFPWIHAGTSYWRDLNRPGRFKPRAKPGPDNPMAGNLGLLAAHVRIKAGETGRVRFVIAWHFPVCENYWSKWAGDLAAKAGVAPRWRNYYATVWKDSADSACYALGNWSRLHGDTRLFRDTLFASDLPPAALEAVSANLSTLKSPTVLRLEDGTLYGFEGCCCGIGCCEGSCTHVWNYAQALPFLFPKLARSMRDVDYRYNQQANGAMPFRLQLPLGIRHPGDRSCADGLFGSVMLVYRDWKLSGDTDWLRTVWPAVKKSIAYAWDPSNEDQWDPDKTGVLWGRQHHTLDLELLGPSSWLCGFYLGALKAASEMAGHLGDVDEAREYGALFAKGKEWVDKHLFNGEFYQQLIDLKDESLMRRYQRAEHYWDPENRELRYQIGEGCGIDQVLAQWHATLSGLGEIFDPVQNRKALQAIYRHNFIRRMRDHFNPCRSFALGDESGTVICNWPKAGTQPATPLPYAQEAMHGFEYAVGIQMIQAGLVRDGMTVVKSVRDRYDGAKRNPWNEIECGSNYARSMASYALLNAFSGLSFDAVQEQVGFAPVRMRNGIFRCFWSLGSGWGEVRMDRRGVEIRVLRGSLHIRSVKLPIAISRRVRTVRVGGQRLGFTKEDGLIRLERARQVRQGQSLELRTS